MMDLPETCSDILLQKLCFLLIGLMVKRESLADSKKC